MVTAIMVFTVLMAVWQRDFVMAGVLANPYLNLTIAAGFLFGVAVCIYHLFALRDDFFALDGLYEALDDARVSGSEIVEDGKAAERLARLKKPAHMFGAPQILGSGYNLMSQEIGRAGVPAISNATKKLLLDEIDERISDRAAFAAYIAGLMVLLGLLGTFIGLMETVGSVGAIISGLDLAGGAGVRAIQELITNLRAPLNGMATGFSSSLFGLIASLIIGLMSRIAGSAANALRSDFERWANQVARLDNVAGDEAPVPPREGQAGERAEFDPDDPGAAPSVLGSSSERLLMRVARLNVTANNRIAQQMKHLAEVTEEERALRRSDRSAVAHLGAQFEQALTAQGRLLEKLCALVEQNEAAAETQGRKSDELRAILHHGLRAVAESTLQVKAATEQTALASAKSTNDLIAELSPRLDGVAAGTERLRATVDSRLEHLSATTVGLQSAWSAEAGRIIAAVDGAVDALRAEVRNMSVPPGWEPAESQYLLAALDATLSGARLSPEEVACLRRLLDALEAENGSGTAEALAQAARYHGEDVRNWLEETSGEAAAAEQAAADLSPARRAPRQT